jgi:putative MATE family efflux protein
MKNTQQDAQSISRNTKGVQTLMGNPKKAIVKLSIPMIVAMSVHTLYSFVDGLWVAGLGPDALSAVGFFFPFFFLIMAISAGIGVGGSSAVSRMIGAQDKKSADDVASHTMALMLISALILALPFFIFAPSIFARLGAGPVTSMTGEYARIIFGGTLIIFFGQVASALLRGEGDVKRAMVVMMISAGLNILLDPIFIYGLKLGVAGAAWATIISICFSSGYLFYWFFIKRDTYVDIKFRGFRFRKTILVEILKVGAPASFQQMTMSIFMLILNMIAVKTGGTDAVAIFTTGWRVVMFATLPLLGMATAVVSVTGAAYGGRDYKKLDNGYLYAIKI